MSELPVKAKEGASVSHECSRFTVAPSPLNGIKLELGIVLLIATTLYVVVEIALLTGWLQVIVLGLYGLSAGAWLTVRARRVLAAAVAERDGDPE